MNKALLEKIKAMKSYEEVIAQAKVEGIDLKEEQAKELFAKWGKSASELADDELDAVSGGGCSGYASSSIDGHYYKLVNDRTDSCKKFVCMDCGCGRGQHVIGCNLSEGLGDVCLICQHSGGHQLLGSYCKIDYK